MATGVTVISVQSYEALRRFVHQTLCRQDSLDPVQNPLRDSVIRRSGRPCGLFFHVEGPRLLRSYAIWAGDEDRILFYDSAGVRGTEVLLSEAPDPQELAA